MNSSLANQARCIVAAHEQLALNPGASQRLEQLLVKQAPANPEQVLQIACLALDFWPTDAQCIAQAWQCQTQRNGEFDPLLWPSQASDFGLPTTAPSAHQNNAFAPCPRQLGLYAVLPSAAWVGRMARAGVPTLQLRFKASDCQAIQDEVNAAVQAVKGTPARLFINDHWQAAIKAGAYGVHLGQEDLQSLQPDDLAQLRNCGLRLGVSSHGYFELLRAAKLQPSYIALGAVFATTLKRMATPPQGVARLARYAQLLRHWPTVAIGGIDLARLPSVLASGVGSVAVVRALVNAKEPEAAAAEFLARLASFTTNPQPAGKND